MIKISYDTEGDALYNSFKQRLSKVTTVQLSENVAIDFGTKEEIVLASRF